MKKFGFLLFLVVCLLTLAACGKTCTVTFESNGKTIEVKVKQNQKVEEQEPFNYEGNTFLGWYLDDEEFDFNNNITSDITLKAYLDPIYYTVVFKNDEGKTLKSDIYGYGEEIIAPKNPSKRSDSDFDYTFEKWDTEFDVAKSDLVITAVFTKTVRKYEVKFTDEENNVISTLNVAKGSKVEFVSQVKEQDSKYSYEFDGWYKLDGTKFDFNTEITSDVRLVSKYFKTPVKFDTKNKIISIIGDSVSTFYKQDSPLNSYYSGKDEFYYPTYCPSVNNVDQTWWKNMADGLGAKIGINNSLSGSAVSGSTDRAGQSDARVNTLGENGTPDIIVTYLGINDNVNGTSVSNIKQAYKSMLRKLIAKYPNAYIFCVITGYSPYETKESHYNYTDRERLEINNAIKELINEFQLGCIDISNTITESNYTKYLADNLHYNPAGMKAIGEKAIADIKEYFNQAKN